MADLRTAENVTTTPAGAFAARLCFAGLWLLADRAGRLEDRPRRIKKEIFPYDDVDVDALLTVLHEGGFITRYISKGEGYIWVNRFLKHQTPHMREPDSIIPAPARHSASTVLEQGTSPAQGQHQAGPLLHEAGRAVRDPVDPVPESVPDPESVPETESESESLSGVGDGDGKKSSAAKTAARPAGQEGDSPDRNVGVIAKIAHECIETYGDNGDLPEHVKQACARRCIAYDSRAVGKAIESAQVVRRIRRVKG